MYRAPVEGDRLYIKRIPRPVLHIPNSYRASIGHVSNTIAHRSNNYWTPIPQPVNRYRTSSEAHRTHIDHLPSIYRQNIEQPSNTNPASIEHSNTDRTRFEHLSHIYQTSNTHRSANCRVSIASQSNNRAPIINLSDFE